MEGSKSTLANTDTSSAKTLAPSANAASRDQSSSDQTYSSSTGGQGAGSSNTDGGSGGNSDSTTSGQNYASSVGGSGGSSNATDEGGSSNAGAAPSYVSDVTQPSGTFGQDKPKGKNITEGGFEGEATPTTDIGSENDPGRQGEGHFQRVAQSASGGTGPNQGMQSGEQPYSVLQEDQNL